MSGVSQSLAKLFQGCVQALSEVDMRAVGPKFALQFLATYDLSWATQENGKNPKRLLLESDAAPRLYNSRDARSASNMPNLTQRPLEVASIQHFLPLLAVEV